MQASKTRRGFLKHAAIAPLAAPLALRTALAVAQAATWPTRPLRLICGYPAGSSPDVQARIIADPLAKALGQAVVVENKPGAGGNIGADLVAKSTDGYTIGIIGNGPLTSAKFLYSKLAYDPARDFAPIAMIGSAPLVWVATPKVFDGKVADFIQTLRASGDRLNYGSIGAGSGSHLAMELVKERLGFQAVHVPFAGGPPILTAMMGGEVQMTMLPGSTVAPFTQPGKLRAVAVSSARRSPLDPDLPSMDEIGAKGIDIVVWNAIMGPASMPAANRERLNAALASILHGAEVSAKLKQLGWADADPSAAALSERIRTDTATYGALITAKGYKLD